MLLSKFWNYSYTLACFHVYEHLILSFASKEGPGGKGTIVGSVNSCWCNYLPQTYFHRFYRMHERHSGARIISSTNNPHGFHGDKLSRTKQFIFAQFVPCCYLHCLCYSRFCALHANYDLLHLFGIILPLRLSTPWQKHQKYNVAPHLKQDLSLQGVYIADEIRNKRK